MSKLKLPRRESPSGAPPIFSELVVILALTVANGVFAGAEIRDVSLRAQAAQLVDGADRCQTVETLRSQPERFIATVRIGITVISTTAAAIGGSRMAAQLEPVLRPLPLVGPHAQDLAFVLVVALVSYLSLVIGELVPKSLALRFGETYALIVAKPLAALSYVAEPLVWFLTVSSNVLRGRFPTGRTSPSRASPWTRSNRWWMRRRGPVTPRTRASTSERCASTR